MAASTGFFVTGDAELDAMLRSLPLKLQKKYMRRATRDAAKKTLKTFRDNVPVDTGALRETAKVKAVKRKRGVTGHRIHIDHKLLVEERESRGGRLGKDPKTKEPFFYAAVVELSPDGNKPMRAALYGDEEKTLNEIREQVKQMIRDAAALAKTQGSNTLPAGVTRDRLGRLRDKRARFI